MSTFQNYRMLKKLTYSNHDIIIAIEEESICIYLGLKTKKTTTYIVVFAFAEKEGFVCYKSHQ